MERAARTIKSIEGDMLRRAGLADRRARKSTAVDFFIHDRACDKCASITIRPVGQVVAVLCDEIDLYQQASSNDRYIQARAGCEEPGILIHRDPYKSVPELKSQYNIAYSETSRGPPKG